MEHTEADEVRATLAKRNAAVSAGDVALALAPLTDDVVSYDLQPPLAFVGPAAHDAAGMAEWLTTWDGPVRVEMRDPAVQVSGALAAAWGLSRMRGMKRGYGAIDLWYRSTLFLAKGDGDWRIVHEHHSVPMKMDGSGLAATDLAPDLAPQD